MEKLLGSRAKALLREDAAADFEKFVVVVVSEPLPGVPSTRLYGEYDTEEEGYADLERAGILTTRDGLAFGWRNAVVLPIRSSNKLLEEKP